MTGPTVIVPLVRSVRLNDHVRAVLLREGVLIDPLGAVLSVVALEFVLSGVNAEPIMWVPSRLLGGAAVGLLGVAVARGVLRLNREPSATEAALLLFGTSIAVIALAEHVLPDAGLAAVAVMGVVPAAAPIPHVEAVREFEDDVPRLMIAPSTFSRSRRSTSRCSAISGRRGCSSCSG